MKHILYGCLCSGLVLFSSGIFVSDCQAIKINDLIVVAANATPPAGAGDVPMGQGGEKVSLLPEEGEIADGEIFGIQGGYVHPYINIQGEFSDNLYNVNTDEVDNFLTRVSPGVWFSLPRKKVIPVTITPHNTSPGGLQNQLKDPDSTDRYMAYALGGVDLKYYSENSDLNETDGVAEGLFRYNMRGGLSLQVLDRYSKAEDKFGIETINRETLPGFDSNIFMATADWAVTEKLRFKFDFSNFFLDYDEVIDDFKNRSDNAFDLYGYFNLSEKTSIFLEYKYLDVAYDVATYNDSTQDFYYGGMKWDTTEKLSLLLKAGYQERSFDNAMFEDYSGLALDFQARYRYSEKTNVDLSLYRANEETDSTVASDKTILGVNLAYNQEFTEKFTGSLSLQYEDAEYTQLVSQTRDEQTIYVRPGVQYLFREWLRGELAYSYEQVDSTDEIFEYTTNTFLVNLSFAL